MMSRRSLSPAATDVECHAVLRRLRKMSDRAQPLTLNPEPNSIRNPLPSLGNNTTLENIDGVIGYSYTCVDNGEVVVIYWVECRGEYRNNRLMGK